MGSENRGPWNSQWFERPSPAPQDCSESTAPPGRYFQMPSALSILPWVSDLSLLLFLLPLPWASDHCGFINRAAPLAPPPLRRDVRKQGCPSPIRAPPRWAPSTAIALGRPNRTAAPARSLRLSRPVPHLCRQGRPRGQHRPEDKCQRHAGSRALWPPRSLPGRQPRKMIASRHPPTGAAEQSTPQARVTPLGTGR